MTIPLGVLASLIDAAPAVVAPVAEPEAADVVVTAALVGGALVVPVAAVSDVLEHPTARKSAVAPMADTMTKREVARARLGTDGGDEDEFMPGYTTAGRREIEQRVNHRAGPNASKCDQLQGVA
jgi:hypothetical protein